MHYRHVKAGGKYLVEGTAYLLAGCGLADMAEVVIANEDGAMIVYPKGAYNAVGDAPAIAEGRFQCASDMLILETTLAVVYRGEDGRWWVRPYNEFNDGRFELIVAGVNA